MPTVNCQIPLKLRLAGDLTADGWDDLEHALTRQYTNAFRHSLAEMARTGRWSPEHDVREPYDADRNRPPNYLIPSYDGSGEKKPIPVTGDPASAADAPPGHTRDEIILQRKGGDPLEEMAGIDDSSVQSIVIDPGTVRTRFYTVGGKTYDGKVVSLKSSFKQGDYLLKRATSKDPNRTWDIFNTDGSVYRGGLQFAVVLEGVDFDSLGYTSKVQLKVASGLLPKLIDIEARIKAIKDEVSKTLVNDEEEQAILKMFEDIPPEQSAAFVKRLREEKVGAVPLLERLDRDVNGENNIALHQHLSRLKLQAGGTKSAAALADAPTLAWHDVVGFSEQKAVFSVTPSSNGKYRIRYLGGISSGLYSAPEYSEIKSMGRKDRLNIMTGQGIEVDADQPIIVHDYDNDRQIVLTAEDLIAYQHAGARKFLQDIGTIASLATPAGVESVGARVLAYGIQIASVATLIVDENKLNIRKWFPNWGPAIIDASEKIKIAIAVVGVAQLVQGGWKLFANLRRLRVARSAMDAKAVVSSAEELALADSQAAQLEANSDKLLNQADLARKELGLADEAVEAAQKLEGGAAPNVPEAAAAVTPPTKTQEALAPRAAPLSLARKWSEKEINDIISHHEGHTVREHGWERTQEELAKRVLSDLKIDSSSKWISKEALTETVGEILHKNEREILEWQHQLVTGTQASPPKLDRIPVGRTIGKGYIRRIGIKPVKAIKQATKTGTPPVLEIGVEWVEELSHATIILRPGGPQGFYVLTAIPTVP
jgi:hypothetical protein